MTGHPKWCKHDIELQFSDCRTAGTLVLWHEVWNLVDGLEVDDEIVFDSEDGVGLEPGVVFGVDLKCLC